MKLLFALFAGFLVVLLPSCSTMPNENDQQAFEADLSELTLFLKTLHALDSGDVARARRIASVPVLVDSSSLPSHAAAGHPTPEQRQELVAVARDALDYMLRHKDEWYSRMPSVRMAMRGLQKILTEPEDVCRLKELSDYLTELEKKAPETKTP